MAEKKEEEQAEVHLAPLLAPTPSWKHLYLRAVLCA